MGVMQCDRTGCDNIMCDHLSHTHGYLCRECLEELKEDVLVDVYHFMDSPKSKCRSEALKKTWAALIDEEFQEK